MSIEFDFAQACRQASELEEIAGEIRTLANQKMSNSMQQLSANWKGDSASAFLKKNDLLRDDIADTAETLYSIAASIRTVARRIYEAEMAAKRLAEEIASKLNG